MPSICPYKKYIMFTLVQCLKKEKLKKSLEYQRANELQITCAATTDVGKPITNERSKRAPPGYFQYSGEPIFINYIN